MRGRRPTCAALVLALAVLGGVTRADAATAQSPPAGDAGLRVWNGVGSDVEAGPHVGWSWRAQGDPTAPGALNATGSATGGSDAAAGFASDGPGIDGSSSEIYTIGGRPLSPSAANAVSEPTGPWAFLEKMTLKGVPAPATWALILVGFVMIGVAVRGLLLANRRLARLRTHDDE